MRNEDQGLAAFAPERLEQGDDLVARRFVEVAGGLVAEDHLRLADQRPGDAHALLLAARELRWKVPSALGQPDPGEGGLRPRAALVPAHAPGDERRLDVLLRAERGDQVERLEDEAERAAAQRRELTLAQLRQVATVEEDLSTGRPVQGAQHLEQRRLARARRTLDGEELALGHTEVDAGEGGDVPASLYIPFGHVSQLIQHAILLHQSTRRRASAGRRRAARQPPKAPASNPPATASPAATSASWALTGAPS